jgi:hypothetical protein
VDVRTLDRLVAAGGLRRVPWLGGRSRFARADLERLLAEGVPAAPPGRPRRPPAARARRPASPSDAAEIARLPVPTPHPTTPPAGRRTRA